MNVISQSDWIARISDSWRSGFDSVIATGKLLVAAKRELEHGQFLDMIERKLPFKARTAQRLMAIVNDERLTNAAHGSHLPSSWRTCYELTKLDDDQFSEAMADGRIRPDMERSEVAEIRRLADREARLENNPDEPGCTVEDLQQLIAANKKFSVIYADPPWSFRVYSGKGKARSAERHYDTQSLDDIKALPVGQLADDSCALLLWAVMPQLPEALEVVGAWGFEFKTTAFTWVKQNRGGEGLFTGMGYWTRANAELCLLATKGTPKRQAMDVHQVIISPVSQHSRKPDEAQVRIERLLNGPYLELFGRRATPGWTVWGNEVSRSMFHQEIPKFAGAAE